MLGVVFGLALAVAGATGCSDDSTDTAAAPTTAAAVVSPSAAPSPSATVDTGCPPDVNLMFESLKATAAIVNEIDKSLTGIEEPKCAEGWSTAHTVVKNADSLLVLFKYDPATGKWTPVAVGSDGVCDGAVKVPEAIQAKLHPGC